MKIIQSFWSKPMEGRNSNDPNNRNSGGWLSDRTFLMSFALSCLKLKKYYSDVELITDHAGKRLFIDTLHLPYSSVSTALENLSHHPDLWAVGKLYAYGMQQQPFLHIDNDVLIYRPFDQALMNAPLIAQNSELNFEIDYYKLICQQISEQFSYLPPVSSSYVANGGSVNGQRGYNAGIFGGSDFDFFRRLSATAFETINRNDEHLHTVNLGLLNIFLEQGLFCCMAEEEGKSVATLYSSVSNDFHELIDFIRIPRSGYIHTVGKSKKVMFTNEQIYLRLSIEYPEHFNRINAYCDERLG